jgi:hypothetical protein
MLAAAVDNADAVEALIRQNAALDMVDAVRLRAVPCRRTRRAGWRWRVVGELCGERCELSDSRACRCSADAPPCSTRPRRAGTRRCSSWSWPARGWSTTTAYATAARILCHSAAAGCRDSLPPVAAFAVVRLRGMFSRVPALAGSRLAAACARLAHALLTRPRAVRWLTALARPPAQESQTALLCAVRARALECVRILADNDAVLRVRDQSTVRHRAALLACGPRCAPSRARPCDSRCPPTRLPVCCCSLTCRPPLGLHGADARCPPA